MADLQQQPRAPPPPQDPGPSNDPSPTTGDTQETPQSRRKRNMSNEERLAMADFLLQHSQGEGRLPRTAISAAAQKFHVHRNTASRIWNLMKSALDDGAASDAVTDQVLSRKRGNCGRKKKDYSAALERVKQLPLHQRGSLRALASAVGVPRTTLFRLLRDDDTSAGADGSGSGSATKRTITNSIKPPLSEKNKRERLRFCAAKLRPNGLFDDMFNVVHVNTKWCSLPSRRESKKTKAMFLVAIARPQWDHDRQQPFDGKLGVWPFVVVEPPLPQSNEHFNGATLTAGSSRVFHVMEAVTKKEIQAMITTHVIPAIKQKMPRLLRNGPLYIQLDSQQVRLTPDDPVVAEHGSADGWHIRLQYQPAYSPDLIVLDHSFLREIRADTMPLHHREAAAAHLQPMEELIAGVERSFAALPKRQLNDGFLALQKTMEATMLSGGSNDYELQVDPSKKSLQHDGSLPVSVLCRPEAILACRAALNGAQD
ncbi:hypothetical protein BBJ28_00010050 [Nothophytophthora sp. Chile5]|nr:hypothetical protein BBJ28_00010050 [Nothophytophthora sp. Chile5]